MFAFTAALDACEVRIAACVVAEVALVALFTAFTDAVAALLAACVVAFTALAVVVATAAVFTFAPALVLIEWPKPKPAWAKIALLNNVVATANNNLGVLFITGYFI
jgi:hypothetical protein